jgi:ketosteroid isomerase-like protein
LTEITFIDETIRPAGYQFPASIRSQRREIRMSTTETEIAALEERLRLAELGPDPRVFEELLADDAVLADQSGTPAFAKAKIVAAHQPGPGPKFTRVETRNLQIVDHGQAAVVTCEAFYEGPQFTGTLKFLRVWLRQPDGRWQIIAGSIAG